MKAPTQPGNTLPKAERQQLEALLLLQAPAAAQTKAPPKVDKRLAQASAAASIAPAAAAAAPAAGGAGTNPSSKGSKASGTAAPTASAAQPAPATGVLAGVPSGVGPSAASMDEVVADAHANSQRVSSAVLSGMLLHSGHVSDAQVSEQLHLWADQPEASPQMLQ